MSRKTSVRSTIKNVPILGRIAETAYELIKLPIRKNELNENRLRIDSLSADLKSLAENYSDKLDALSLVVDNLNQRIVLSEKSQLVTNNTTKSNDSAGNNNLFADNHLLDVFYSKFEDKFRGDETTILDRLADYLPDFKKSKVNYKRYPVIDIGCGRGEFLQMLRENGINAMGIDINIDMVDRANKKGLTAIQGDAVDYLEAKDSQVTGAVTGFHIVEHIPFPSLLTMFSAIHRSLVKNGFVLFETPNPENILVGACNFYTDPSHLNPIPPHLLAFALESVGFRKVEIRRIHPVETEIKPGKDPLIHNSLYGPRDYCVIGYK